MTIKQIPVCPICDSNMAKIAPRVYLPTRTETVHVQISPSESRGSLRTSSDEPVEGFLDPQIYYAWKCPKCNFVALFDGNPRG